MNGMDTFNGAGDWMPPTLGEQQAAEINRRRQMAERLAAIGQTLDELGDLPKCGSLTKAKVKDVRQAYQTLHAWAVSLMDVTARVYLLAEDAQQELATLAVEMEKRPARRSPQSQVLLERIRLCKEG